MVLRVCPTKGALKDVRHGDSFPYPVQLLPCCGFGPVQRFSGCHESRGCIAARYGVSQYNPQDMRMSMIESVRHGLVTDTSVVEPHPMMNSPQSQSANMIPHAVRQVTLRDRLAHLADNSCFLRLIRTRFAASRAVLFPLAAGVQASQTGAHRTRLALALVVAGVNSTTLACHVVDTAMRLFKVQGTRRE